MMGRFKRLQENVRLLSLKTKPPHDFFYYRRVAVFIEVVEDVLSRVLLQFLGRQRETSERLSRITESRNISLQKGLWSFLCSPRPIQMKEDGFTQAFHQNWSCGGRRCGCHLGCRTTPLEARQLQYRPIGEPSWESRAAGRRPPDRFSCAQPIRTRNPRSGGGDDDPDGCERPRREGGRGDLLHRQATGVGL